ncbi:hypothetical protein [Candidatus Amarolinea aalborgensis]|jgi:hypothetical protein|uniref:hypothetical protein n=1 Tax=Candidatus Amarolinea aalborgensis TaxID=2249329 RepID=UPI003BFA0E50
MAYLDAAYTILKAACQPLHTIEPIPGLTLPNMTVVRLSVAWYNEARLNDDG